MEPSVIFGPFFAMMLLTFVVWITMYALRIPFIRASGLRPEQLTPSELARRSPPKVSNTSYNLKNLLELPTLFYGLALYLYVTDQVDMAYLAGSWVFAAFRALHSAVHCTFNIVILRFWLYCVSAMALWFMVVRAALQFFY